MQAILSWLLHCVTGKFLTIFLNNRFLQSLINFRFSLVSSRNNLLPVSGHIDRPSWCDVFKFHKLCSSSAFNRFQDAFSTINFDICWFKGMRRQHMLKFCFNSMMSPATTIANLTKISTDVRLWSFNLPQLSATEGPMKNIIKFQIPLKLFCWYRLAGIFLACLGR